ncbi:MAG: NYN domain-containing protein [Elusimicrobia bacterium]|nr:NYN domain-containing protein [Elusimicrobiota bacterium]
MSLYYIVDGYNVIHTHKDFFPGKIENARNVMLKAVIAAKPQGSSRNRITIVFDGQPGIRYPAPKGADIRFTDGREADWKIKKLIDRHPNPRQIVVVTDDRGIIFYARHAGAGVMSTAEFVARLFPKKKSETAVEKEKKISSEAAADISRELEKIWLKKAKK